MLKDNKELDDKCYRQNDSVCVAILAGGLSRRFGRDKSKLKVGADTLVRLIKGTAAQTRYPVRVIRTDNVPRCGPLGGIMTAFTRTRANLIVFLACDMPGVSADWIEKVCLNALRKSHPVFSFMDDRLGFPFALFRRDLETVETNRLAGRYSLRDLARSALAVPLPIPPTRQKELSNINTPEEWAEYRREAEPGRLSSNLEIRNKSK